MKKKNIYKYTVIAMVTIISMFSLSIVSHPNAVTYSIRNSFYPDETQSQEALKDETVYGVLGTNGQIDSLYVVNHLYVPKDGTYVDYGDYENITNLSNNIEPIVSEDTIKWDLKESFNGFYYKGELKAKELPWNFDIKYKLDGEEISTKDLTGKDGEVNIIISATQKKDTVDYFNKNYGMQIQVPINLDNSKIINDRGANKVIAGKTATLAYTILPGESGTYEITLEAKSFEMDSINISITPMNFSSMIDTGEITEGFNSLSEGMGGMVNGTKELKNGTAELSNGINELTKGQTNLVENGNLMVDKMEEYSEGLKNLDTSITTIESGSKEINNGLSQISQEGNSLVEGYKQMADNIKEQLPSEEEKVQLQALAQYANSTDPTMVQLGVMANSMLEQIAGLEKMHESLETLNGGLSKYNSGVSNISNNYGDFHNGLSQLPMATGQLYEGYNSILEGNKQFMNGLSNVNDGMIDLNNEVKFLPDSVDQLVDGQEKIKGGIDEANNSINAMLGEDKEESSLVSFVNQDKGNINSVQFILRTPSITISEKKAEVTQPEEENKNFIERLIDLFKN
ncbi:MAG: hypothetical protein FH761_07085 [Firmicutes bacterium]|nr:hypothetical protein [Bacillota bacterium]